MITLRDAFAKEIEELQEEVEARREDLECIQKSYPAMLDLEADKIRFRLGSGSIAFHNYSSANGLAAKVASILGGGQGKKKMIIPSISLASVTFWIPKHGKPHGIMVDVDHDVDGNCKKYRVVQEKEIEVCGDINPEDYLSVEEIEE